MKNNSIPDFPLDTTTLNSTEIPELDTQTANQLLNNVLARSTWDIIERFWNLDLSFTDTFMTDKYSKFGPAPRTPSCMQRSYLLSIDFKVTSQLRCGTAVSITY